MNMKERKQMIVNFISFVEKRIQETEDRIILLTQCDQYDGCLSREDRDITLDRLRADMWHYRSKYNEGLAVLEFLAGLEEDGAA